MASKEKINLEIEVDTNVTHNGVNPFQKTVWLARAFDSWRIFPRIFLTVYIVLLYKVVVWFMALPDPNINQAGLVSVIVGAGAAWFGLYLNAGGNGDIIVHQPTGNMFPTNTNSRPTNNLSDYDFDYRSTPNKKASTPDNSEG